PGETLMPFEGSGVDTFWSLDLPASANPNGLLALADVLLTLDVDAHYSAELFDVHIAAKPTQRRYIFVSAAKVDPAGLADITGNAAVATITFDLTTLKLPVSEKNRVVTNLVCFLAGKSPDVFEATMGIMKPATDVQVTFQQGLAMSTAPPLVPAGSVSSPLNSL